MAIEIERLKFNPYVTLRLRYDPRTDATQSILDSLHTRDTQLFEILLKQNQVLVGNLIKAASALDRVTSALSEEPDDSEAGALCREIEFAQELLAMI